MRAKPSSAAPAVAALVALPLLVAGCGAVTFQADVGGSTAHKAKPAPSESSASSTRTTKSARTDAMPSATPQSPTAPRNPGADSGSASASAGVAAATAKKPDWITVTDRFSDVTDADAMDLGKIKGVVDRATPDMLYSAGTCASGGHPFSYVPTVAGVANNDPDFGGVDKDAGTPEHPYTTIWTQEGNVRLSQRETSVLAPGTPLLVWSATKDSLIVVTMDGGRYRVNPEHWSDGVHFVCHKAPLLRSGWGLPLPPPLQHVVLVGTQIRSLEDAGQLPTGTSQKIEDARKAASDCTDRLWATRFDARDKANTVANITQLTRENRRAAILDEYQDATPKVCAAPKHQFDAAFEAAIEARKKARAALYQSVSAKVTELAGQQ
jgi:hypothetical protein